MLRGYRIALAGLLLLGGRACPQGKPASAAEAFREGLAELQDLARKGKWREGIDLLGRLLTEHREEDYVRRRREELLDLARRCAFGLDYRPPRPEALVSGKLLRHAPGTGEIRILYTPATARDLQAESGRLVFPARLTGPFTVEIRGRAYPALAEESPMAMVGGDRDPRTGQDAWWQILFGSPPRLEGRKTVWLPAKILRLGDGEPTEEAGKEIPQVKAGEPYRLSIKVTADRILAQLNGRSLGQATKPRAVFGGFAFTAPEWEEMELAGTVEPSWIQGLVDREHQAQAAAFAKRFEPSRYLPEWLLARAEPRAEEAGAAPFPDELSEKLGQALRPVLKLLGREKPRLALEALEHHKNLPPATRAFLEARIRLGLNQPGRALQAAARAEELAPGFTGATILKGMALCRLGRADEAVPALREAMATHTCPIEYYEWAARSLLLAARADAAKEIVDLALARGAASPGLERLNRTAVKASHGPQWARTFEFQSAHYLVLSDIDRETCRRAAQVLEEALLAFKADLQDVKWSPKIRFRVFLFGGQEGYAEYCRDLWGEGQEQTAGLYDPALKQLLIWNLPSREEMIQTIRHEGFHQFLDQLAPGCPLWLHEGLAEYYATGRWEGGSFRGGQLSWKHLETLKKGKLVPCREFLLQGEVEFHEGGEGSYAQAWAIAYLLRLGEPRFRQLFREAMAGLMARQGAEALAEVFTEKAMGLLDRELGRMAGGRT